MWAFCYCREKESSNHQGRATAKGGAETCSALIIVVGLPSFPERAKHFIIYRKRKRLLKRLITSAKLEIFIIQLSFPRTMLHAVLLCIICMWEDLHSTSSANFKHLNTDLNFKVKMFLSQTDFFFLLCSPLNFWSFLYKNQDYTLMLKYIHAVPLIL